MIHEVTGQLVVDPEVRKLCKKSYPGHSQGCPSFKKGKECPSKVGLLWKYYNMRERFWVCIREFNLKAHVAKRKKKFPHYTYAQCKNLLYWQPTVKMNLKEDCRSFIRHSFYEPHKMRFDLIPEAQGLNVFETCENIGIILERHQPISIVRKVALIGSRKREHGEFTTLGRSR